MSSHNQSSQKIQFTSLSPEIRHQIWNLTLSSRRILVLSYNVRRSHRYFKFLNNYPFPIILQICRDSRAAALSQGFFFTPNSDQSVYFIPKTDIVCFDSRATTILEMQASAPIPGLDRVLNVGFDWRYFFCWRHLPDKKHLREVVERFYVYMPLLKTFNHIPLISFEMGQGELAIETLPRNFVFRWKKITQ